MRSAVVAGVVGLLVCSPTGVSGSPQPVIATPVVATSVSTVQISTLPTATPEVLVSPSVLTDADNGAVVQLRVGDELELRLSQGLTWTTAVDDPSVLGRNGAEYAAVGPGSTALSADGEPACRRVTPPCGLPDRLFQVRVDVSP